MSDLGKIVGLLKSDAIEKQIAATIVLGELKAKGPEVVSGLSTLLASEVPLLQCHALEALANVGATKALPSVFPLLAVSNDDVRRAAVRAVASVGEDVVPLIRQKLKTASGEERRALDSVLAELGGKDAFSALIRGLASGDGETAKAAAVATRQQIKQADGRQRRSYLVETEKFLREQKKKKGAPEVIAAAIKILGYLEDARTLPTLVAYASPKETNATVRQEAIIALRFALGGKSASARVIDALVSAAEAEDRTLAQTALHTLAGLKIGADVTKRLAPLAMHKDIERARFVILHLGRTGGVEAARVLVNVLAKKDERYAEPAAQSVAGKEEAVPALVKAILDSKSPERANVMRNVLRQSAKKIGPAAKKQLLAVGIKRLSSNDPTWQAPLDVLRDADPSAHSNALRDLAAKWKKSGKLDKARNVLELLLRTEKVTDDDRYLLASLDLKRSMRDTRPEMRSGDPALRLFDQLLQRGFDVAKAIRGDRSVTLEEKYYLGFHYIEQDHPLGEEMLHDVIKKAGRTKIGNAAKNKLDLATLPASMRPALKPAQPKSPAKKTKGKAAARKKEKGEKGRAKSSKGSKKKKR